MTRALRIGLVSAVMGVALAFAAAPSVQAQVNFSARFRGPHGAVAFQIGSPYYPVGSFIPYAQHVEFVPSYGYGFRCNTGAWVPVRRVRERWVVVERPVVVVEQRFRDYDDGYAPDGYADWRQDDRYYGYDRYDAYDRGYAPYGGYSAPQARVSGEICVRH